MKRQIFGLNGRRVEMFPIVRKDTYEAWKRGELMFLESAGCFATYEMNDQRDKYIKDIVISKDKWDEWDALSYEEKQKRYISYLKKRYNAMTYEEFKNDESFAEQNIEVIFPYGEVGIVFYQKKPNTNTIEL